MQNNVWWDMEEPTNFTASNELSNAVQVIKGAILQSQQRALKAINQEQLALYYGIGRYISVNTRKKNWGKGFIEALSEQLRKELPGLRGFSAPSMRKMRMFYEEWKELSANSFVETNKLESAKDNSFVTTNKNVVRAKQDKKLPAVQLSIDASFPIAAFVSIGFSHHFSIVSKVKDAEQRKFYIQVAADTKATVEDLEKMIDADLYHHQGELANNFKKTIPDQLQAFRAIRMFKDEYLLDYINTEELFVRDKDRDEKVIEKSIVNNVKNFIM